MTPIEFVVFEGDSKPNQPVYQVAEAMQKPIKIHSGDQEWTILSYFFHEGQMVLELEEKS